MSDWSGVHWRGNYIIVGAANAEDGHRVTIHLAGEGGQPLVCVEIGEERLNFTARQTVDLAEVLVELARRIQAAESRCGECKTLSWDWRQLLPLADPKQAPEGGVNEPERGSQ